MKKIMILAAMTFIIMSCSSSSKGKSEYFLTDITEITDAVAERDYKINALRAIPQKGRIINLSGGYYLRVSGDSVFSRLPYYGRAYSLPYTGGEGLIFDGIVNEYEVRQGKRNEQIVTFKVYTQEDRYVYYLNIWPDGSSDIRVQPNNKQYISFTGDIVKRRDEE